MLTKQDLRKRLERLEAHYLVEPMTVLCVTVEGAEILTSVDEMIRIRADFRCVKHGSSLADLDKILDYKGVSLT